MNHPLFTQGMKLYSDSKVSSFINSITRDQCIAFQNEWNNRHDHREKIYITYDSTNKNCQAGNLECVEVGHPKDDDGKLVLNYSIAYDHNNSEPLYYEEISLCGYFVIITSEKMTAADALDLYKSWDASEKLFREDKTFLGDRTMRCQTNEALHAKIFIEFVALIIRNRMHFLLKEQMLKTHHKENYMTVPAAIRELEKIEIVRHIDREYSMDYAVTATQKSILKAFGLAETNVRKQTAGINEDLKSYNTKEA